MNFILWLKSIWLRLRPAPKPPQPVTPPAPDTPQPGPVLFHNPQLPDGPAEYGRGIYQPSGAKGRRIKFQWPSSLHTIYGINRDDLVRVTWADGTTTITIIYQIDTAEGKPGFMRPKFDIKEPTIRGEFCCEMLGRDGRTIAAFRWPDYERNGDFRLPEKVVLP
jgi:hypothetical protein